MGTERLLPDSSCAPRGVLLRPYWYKPRAKSMATNAAIGAIACLTVLGILFPSSLLAQIAPPSYLAEMPSVDKVMQAMRTSDPDETAARQMAAFTHLKNMIEKLAGPRFPKNQLTPEENKLRQAYYTAYWQIAKSKPQYGPFTAMRGLDIDIKFRDEIIQKCFPPSFAAEYSKLTGEAIAQNKAFHDQGQAARAEREQARADAAPKEQPNAQETYAKVQQQLDSVKLQSLGLLSPEQSRCVAAGRPEASCLGNALLGGFTQMISQVLPAAGKQSARPSGPTMSGVFVGPGNWRIDFMHDGVLVNCAMLSPNEETYAVRFENGRTLVVIDTKPKPLVLTLTADGNLVGPGPVVIDGVIATGYHRGISDAVEEDQYGNKYNILGYKASETAGYDTFSPQRTTCPAQNLSSKGAGVGVETMEFNVLKMAVGADQGPPIPPGVRMSGIYAANTGFNVEFFPESAIVACGAPARAYPYHVVANGSQAGIKIEDPTRPLLLSFRPDGTLDPGSGSYLVHGRRIIGKDSHDNFTFAPLEGTCNLGILAPGAAPASVGGSAAGAAKPSGPAMAVPGKPTGNAVLSIVSGFPNAPDTPNALAMATLTLLRDSLTNVFSNAGIHTPGGSPQTVIANACRQDVAQCQAANQALLVNAAALARADGTGKGTFPGVPAGTYYLMLSGRYKNQDLYWDLKVDLKSGANSVALDQSNAKPSK